VARCSTRAPGHRGDASRWGRERARSLRRVPARLPVRRCIRRGADVSGWGRKYVSQLLQHIEHGELSPQAIISHRMALSDAAAGYELFNEKLEDRREAVLIPG
jgi:threonine dehydrogenase-like Zn-dependent dehydrogenase